MDASDRYTWTLTPDQYHATVEKISTINARAARRGFTGRLEISGVRTTEKVPPPSGRASWGCSARPFRPTNDSTEPSIWPTGSSRHPTSGSGRKGRN